MPYVGYSMSLNAAIAYDNEEKPISKWTKAAILAVCGEKAGILSRLTAEELRNLLLYRSSWHHTSCKYNRTDFYAVDEEKLEEVTEETVRRIIADRTPRQPKQQDAPRTIRAEVTYTIWVGRYARYRKPQKVTEIVTYRSDEKTVQTSNGTKRLSSMESIRELCDVE